MSLTMIQLQAMGDRSPDDASLLETAELVRHAVRDDTYGDTFPLSNHKVIELIESIIALRAALAGAMGYGRDPVEAEEKE